MLGLRTLARPMLASIFILGGYDTFRNPERVAPTAEPVVSSIPGMSAKPEDAVRLNGAIQMVAGSLLGLGWLPRLSSLAIAATLVPTTAAGHRFWEAEDEATKAQQQVHFLKNLSMLGGLLIAAADTGGKPSLAWRARYRARTARRTAELARKQAARTARVARVSAKGGAGAGKAAAVGKAGGWAAKMLAKGGAGAGKAGGRAAKVSAKGAGAGKLAGRAAKGSAKGGAKAATKAAKAAGRASR
ncbi:MAG: DoxX family protein [Streptosporangiaceae bacterium]|nr:DoxX family protein [Streptosporangiaceae bacterium]